MRGRDKTGFMSECNIRRSMPSTTRACSKPEYGIQELIQQVRQRFAGVRPSMGSVGDA